MTETNSSKLNHGQLDEKFVNFRIVGINDQKAAIAFQFETGGFMLEFDTRMTMTEIADRFDAAAERVRKFQREGWPMQKATIHEGHH